MKPTIYEQHDAAFRHVNAYVIMRGRERVGTVAIKYPRDGAGRLWAYVHFLGMPMVRGYAGGYGYDKKTAALSGLIIDGHTLANHCGGVPEDEKKRERLLREYAKNHATRDYDYWRKRAERIGASWANYDRESGRYRDLYFRAGLDRLSDLGYSVIFAI